MKKLIIVFAAILFCLRPEVKADEGMWIPMLVERLNYTDMQKMGLNLTPEEIYSINHSSLKDAIVIFGGGCTGEIISSEGLLITNHHCGYGSIQSVSTVENNLLTNGFWAMSKDEEIPIEGLSVKFLIKIEVATEKVLDSVTANMTEEQRSEKIQQNIEKITETAKKDNDYQIAVRSFFNGNEYYTFAYETYKDIRFVGAPPEAIGKFGSDTDNWMWPRHTGDFSMFRVYGAPDGSPSEYAKENVPITPKHYLPVSTAGVKKGDFAMILGYPGGTDRYLTSHGVKLAVDQSNMTIVDIRAKKLDIMKEFMNADKAVRLQYASKYARISNYWKYFIGQTKGLKRLKVYDKKAEIENKFTDWVNADKIRKDKYGEALPDIAKAYEIIGDYNLSNWYFREAIYRGPEILGFSRKFSKLQKTLGEKEKNEEKIAGMISSIKETTDKYFKNYFTPIDKKLLAEMFKMYHENVPLDQQPAFLLELANKYKDDFYKYTDKVFKKSIFASKENVYEFLENPKAKKIEKDPVTKAVKAFFATYRMLSKKSSESQDLLERGNRLFIAGLMEMQPEKTFYPDANFTMRLTYGTVQDYYPADAVHFNYFTTLDGVMEKEDPSTFEFLVPEKLKEIYKNKDYGKYGENGEMKVCFLTDHDITGGNSGSPVINGNGELIGLAFDGNWEAMSGDIAFEPELQRTINVDIRYVLLIIDKLAGAQNLIDEMTIVSKKPEPIKAEISLEVEMEMSEK